MHGKIPVYGYRIDNFAYLTDLKTIEEVDKKKLKNLDILVLNALRIETPYTFKFRRCFGIN